MGLGFDPKTLSKLCAAATQSSLEADSETQFSGSDGKVASEHSRYQAVSVHDQICFVNKVIGLKLGM